MSIYVFPQILVKNGFEKKRPGTLGLSWQAGRSYEPIAVQMHQMVRCQIMLFCIFKYILRLKVFCANHRPIVLDESCEVCVEHV